jgi:fructose 1,6-bisphosphatase
LLLGIDLMGTEMTPDDPRAALREKVVKLYADKWGVTDAWLADAAIAVVLEEAARVADEKVAYSSGQEVIRESIAAAIRGMKSSPGSGS